MTDKKKSLLSTLYQFETSVPRRSYFSQVPPVEWSFDCYCSSREHEESNLNTATLRRDFISDLKWLQAQNRSLPRELKQHIKSLENVPAVSSDSKERQAVLTDNSSRQKIFEDTVTVYTQAVSQTIQAEVQLFSSNPASSFSSSMNLPSTTSTTLSCGVKRKARYTTIYDFLIDNELSIMVFGEPNKYIVNGVNVVLESKTEYHRLYKKATYFDDIHKMQ